MLIRHLRDGDEAMACKISTVFHPCAVELCQVTAVLANPMNFRIAKGLCRSYGLFDHKSRISRGSGILPADRTSRAFGRQSAL